MRVLRRQDLSPRIGRSARACRIIFRTCRVIQMVGKVQRRVEIVPGQRCL